MSDEGAARLGVRSVQEPVEAGTTTVRPDLSVIIVVTENPQPLDLLYEQFAAAFESLGETYEFVFVGEPQARASLKSVRDLADEGRPIRVFEAGERTGESNLLLIARDHCRGVLYVTLPCYQRIEPLDIGKLIDCVRAGAALASAARVQDNDNWINRASHWGFHFLLRRFVGTDLRDMASGVRVLRPEVLDEVPLYGAGFRFLPLLAAREAFRVEEVEVAQHSYDQRLKIYSAGTYLRRLVDLAGMAFLSRFTHKPLRFFGLIGGWMALGGGAVLLVLGAQRIAGTALANRPALVGATLLIVLGVQSIALGLIGEIIVHFSVSSRPAYRLERSFPQPQDAKRKTAEREEAS